MRPPTRWRDVRWRGVTPRWMVVGFSGRYMFGQLAALAPAGGACVPVAGVVVDDEGAVVDGVEVAA